MSWPLWDVFAFARYTLVPGGPLGFSLSSEGAGGTFIAVDAGFRHPVFHGAPFYDQVGLCCVCGILALHGVQILCLVSVPILPGVCGCVLGSHLGAVLEEISVVVSDHDPPHQLVHIVEGFMVGAIPY